MEELSVHCHILEASVDAVYFFKHAVNLTRPCLVAVAGGTFSSSSIACSWSVDALEPALCNKF